MSALHFFGDPLRCGTKMPRIRKHPQLLSIPHPEPADCGEFVEKAASGGLVTSGQDRTDDGEMKWVIDCTGRDSEEVKRRADVVGIFPNEASITRLIGAVLLEQNDE